MIARASVTGIFRGFMAFVVSAGLVSIVAIGSGGNYAYSAALAMAEYEDDAETLAKKAMAIADKICVFTNNNLTLEIIE